MQSKRQLAFWLLIAGIAMGFTLHNVSWQSLSRAFSQADFFYLLPCTLMVLGGYFMRILRWRVLVSQLRPVSVLDITVPVVVGLVGNLLPLRAGEVLRAYWLRKKTGISFSASLGTVMVDRICDLILLGAIFSGMLFGFSDLWSEGAQWEGQALDQLAGNFGFAVAGSLGVGLLGLWFLVFRRKLMQSWFAVLVSLFSCKLKSLLEQVFEKVLDGLSVIKSFSVVLRILGYSVLEWVFVIGAYYPLSLAFHLEDLSMRPPLVLAVLIPIFMTVMPTPGFVGSIQAAVYVGLHQVLGESEAAAVGYGMVLWGWGVLIQLAGGLGVILFEHLSLRQIVDMEKDAESILFDVK